MDRMIEDKGFWDQGKSDIVQFHINDEQLSDRKYNTHKFSELTINITSGLL